MTVVVYDNAEPCTVAADGGRESDALWLSPADLERATGWVVKPEGLCKGDACVPLPADGSWTDSRGRVDLAAFARRQGRPVVRDTQRDIWAFGAADLGGPQGVEAPDFTFPDIDGRQHSLSDYRGKKVFLYTWGSYCGCSFDPPVWESVYDELKAQNLEMISVALDTAGSPAVEERIRPPTLDERPDVIRALRGWSMERWSAKAPPSHPCLIDEDHELAVSYGMDNVPMAVWIDEQGRIVRPPEPAGVSDHFRSMDPESFELPEGDARALVENRERYVAALEDWVAKGPDSPYALSSDEVRARLRRPDRQDIEAALHVRIGRYLHQAGDLEGAKEHVRTAAEMSPAKWSYKRQAMVLDPDLIGALNVQPGYWAAMDEWGTDRDFYPDIDMPGMSGAEDWRHRPSSEAGAAVQ